jgi:hypothetical protein
MLDHCCECGSDPDGGLILDIDSAGYSVQVCGPCFRGEAWEE